MSTSHTRRVACVGTLMLTLGLSSCSTGLTDNPLTDSEVSAFLTQATDAASASHGGAFEATVAAAREQRSAITGTAALIRARSEAGRASADLRTRTEAIAPAMTSDEAGEVDTRKGALDEALKGSSVDGIYTALSDYTSAVEAAEAAVASRQLASGDEQVPAPSDGTEAGQAGGGTGYADGTDPGTSSGTGAGGAAVDSGTGSQSEPDPGLSDGSGGSGGWGSGDYPGWPAPADPEPPANPDPEPPATPDPAQPVSPDPEPPVTPADPGQPVASDAGGQVDQGQQ